jgi:hypothetical protein
MNKLIEKIDSMVLQILDLGKFLPDSHFQDLIMVV